MSWLTLTVNADAQYADSLSDALLELGALSVDIHDADADTAHEQALFGEPGEPPAQLWSANKVTAMFPEAARIDDIMQQASHAIGLESTFEYSTATLADHDWVRLTQSQFNPIKISQRLWIVPTWHTPADPSAINITLDPGLAFGTGSHPTTRLCLHWLDDHIKGGETVLDYGCGSGILAIAALKLGAANASGIDLDAQAVQASRDNAAANHVQAKFFQPDHAPKIQADIVIANILTNPLKMLAPLLAGSTRTGGKLVLSGILSAQAGEVMAIYKQWFNLEPPSTEEGWIRLCGEKR